MATIKEICNKCKAGQIDEAYELAKIDIEKYPQYPWPKSNLGWVLYYKIREDTTQNNRTKLLDDLAELSEIGLTLENDSMVLSNVVCKLASYLHQKVPATDIGSISLISAIFIKIKNMQFPSDQWYSFLLSSMLHYKTWPWLLEFIEWWNIEKLRREDYEMYVPEKGRPIMSLAERVYNAYTSCLLKVHDEDKIHDFLPKLESLVFSHQEMTYPSYCYARLLLLLGTEKQVILASYIPFARKKVNDSWVWKTMAEIVNDDVDTQTACLLRAIHCTKDESFLGKIRGMLATIYVEKGDRARAKHQVDMVNKLYIGNGWHVPNAIQVLSHMEWINTTKADKTDPDIDYMSITNGLLYNDTKNCLAVVSFVDTVNHRAGIIYDLKKRATIRLKKLKVRVGDTIKIYYEEENEGKIKVLNAFKTANTDDLPFAKRVEGDIQKKAEKDFAFLKCGSESIFVSPNIVKEHRIGNDEHLNGIAIFDYNKKKDSWGWVLLTVRR